MSRKLVLGMVFGSGLFSALCYSSSLPTQSTVSVHSFTSEIDSSPLEILPVPGEWSTIRRSSEQICINSRIKSLPEGVYTVWWVAFDTPQECQGGSEVEAAQCSLADIDNPSANPTVFRGSSDFVGPLGSAGFNSCIEYGETPVTTELGDGIHNPDAEIQLIVKWHGEATFDDLDNLGKQLTVSDGGCDVFAATDYLGRSFCPDVRLIVHPD